MLYAPATGSTAYVPRGDVDIDGLIVILSLVNKDTLLASLIGANRLASLFVKDYQTPMYIPVFLPRPLATRVIIRYADTCKYM